MKTGHRTGILFTLAVLVIMASFAAVRGVAQGKPASLGDSPNIAPELPGGLWVSGKPTTIASLRGRVVVLTFWTRGCINCRRTLPYWNTWAKNYASPSSSVSVLSVHTPETPWERSPDAVRRFVREQSLRFPVLLDNDSKNWNAYDIHAWPTTILIDKKGRIRERWEGELNFNRSRLYRTVEARIEALRREKAS